MIQHEWTDDSLAILTRRLSAPLPKRCECTCGGVATHPRLSPEFAENCYRRWLRLKRPAVLLPPDPVQAARGRKGAKARGRWISTGHRAEPAGAACDPRVTRAWLEAEARRRVAREQGRALAYLAVRGGRDVLAPARIRERVKDGEAFRVLCGCQGSEKAAVRLLADLEEDGIAA